MFHVMELRPVRFAQHISLKGLLPVVFPYLSNLLFAVVVGYIERFLCFTSAISFWLDLGFL